LSVEQKKHHLTWIRQVVFFSTRQVNGLPNGWPFFGAHLEI